MSTAIYNGFSVSASSSVSIMDTVRKFRPYIETQGQKMFKSFLHKNGFLDDSFNGRKFWLDLRSQTINKGIRAPELDTDFQLTLFPDKDRFLGIAFTEHEHWFRHWLLQPSVREYRYWNNTDRPSGISQKEWDRRAQVWDRVLGRDAPSTRGFTITLHEIDGPSLQFKSARKPRIARRTRTA